MNCRDFWTRYDENGLTPELESHLHDCPGCRKEMDAEQALMGSVKDLPAHQAPDHLWDRIARELPEKLPRQGTIRDIAGALTDRIRDLLTPGRIFRLKPVIIGLVIMATSVLATRYYYTQRLFFDIDAIRQVESPRDLEDIEREYLAAIESLTKQVEHSKDSLDPELYDLYSEKLAILDDYIQQCREALNENKDNPNARQYLALAYKEKMDTLREMAGHL